MSNRLLITPNSMNIDDRVSLTTRQLWKDSGHVRFAFPPQDQALSFWTFYGVNSYTQWKYDQDDLHTYSAWNGGPPGASVRPSTSVGVGGTPGEGAPGFVANATDGIKIHGPDGARIFDTEEQSLYISNVYQGTVDFPSLLNMTENSRSVVDRQLGTCPLDSDFKLGFLKISSYYTDPLDMAQITDTLYIDRAWGGNAHRFLQLIISGGNVILRTQAYLVGNAISLSSVTVKYIVWVGKYN